MHPETWRPHFLVSGSNSLASLMCVQQKASGLALSPYKLKHYLLGSITQLELHDSQRPQQTIQESSPVGTKALPGATQGSDMKTLRSLLLLLHLQLDNTIPAIHRSSYALRSFPHFKHCNTPILMQTVINDGRYLCMVILQSSGTI